MPVKISAPLVAPDLDSFHRVDRIATGLAFDIHNEFGRYLDETLYARELSARLSHAGISVAQEMEIDVSLRDFSKSYFVDILAAEGVVIEIKTVANLLPAHRAQVLNYLYLCDLRNGTLLNFRKDKVQREFVSTSLSFAVRRKADWILDSWRSISSECDLFETILRELIDEWGFGLNPQLYRDALSHFFGGDSRTIRDASVYSGSRIIGSQKVHHVTDDIVYSVTTSLHRPELVREHHRRFLAHTKLAAVHWVNLKRGSITMETIQK